MATGEGNGRKGRNGSEQAAAPAAINEASSDLSEPDLTSAFHPACSIAPRSTRIRMSNVTVRDSLTGFSGNLQHWPQKLEVIFRTGRCTLSIASPRPSPIRCLRALFLWIMTRVKFLISMRHEKTRSNIAHETRFPASDLIRKITPDARLAALPRAADFLEK